jgi:hypothetical protein
MSEIENLWHTNDITKLGLEQHAFQLDDAGLTIVPPEKTGVPSEKIDRAVDAILARFTEVTGGCPISIEEGPMGELEFAQGRKSRFPGMEDNQPKPTQTTVGQLIKLDRSIRDLAVNPVANALIDYIVGPEGNNAPQEPGEPPPKARRLSNGGTAFIKWQGEYGYGANLGLHCDQNGSAMPWGRNSLACNAMWCLTEYSKEGGALCYVPGSHKSMKVPTGANEAHLAVPVEAPRGSLVVWHGATWHGAFPKQTPGLRLNATLYYRHLMVMSQENLRITMEDEPWDDCGNPELMRDLIGFDDRFPYSKPGRKWPKFVGSNVK